MGVTDGSRRSQMGVVDGDAVGGEYRMDTMVAAIRGETQWVGDAGWI